MSDAQANPAFAHPAGTEPSDGPNEGASAARGPRRGGAGVLGVLARNWMPLTAWGLLCAAAAWYLGDRLKTLTWQAEGTLICTAPTLSESQKAAYAPLNPDTLISLVKEPNNLEALRREFGLAMPARELDKRIKVSRPSNSDMIVVSLDWPEPQAGAALVNRLMSLHAAATVGLRKRRTEEAAAAVRAATQEARAMYDHAVAEQAAFLAAQAGRDPQADAARVGAEIATLEASLLAVNGECEDCERRLKGPAGADAAGLEPGSVLYQRRTQLRDALETEKGALAEGETALASKRQEHDAAARFVVNNIIPRADFDKLTGELEACRQRVQNSRDAIKRYEQELSDLPTQAAALQKAQWKQRLDDKRREATLLQSAVAAKRGQAEEAAEQLRRAAPLAEKVKDAKAELEQYEAQATALRQLHDSDAEEVAILTAAAPAAAPASSTRKTVTAAAFAIPMLLFAGFLVVRDRRRAAQAPAAALEKMGLAVLTPPPGRSGGPAGRDAGGGAARQFRRIAMRVRDRLADAGPVVLFSSVNGGPETQRLAFHVSRLLGTRDARVLILDVRRQGACGGESHAGVPLLAAADAPDAGGKGPTALAMVQVLDTNAGLADALQPTSSESVDYLHAGEASDPDFLASQQMGDLLDALAEKYARVIVVAPPVGESLGAESLAAWSDVVVLSAQGAGGKTPAGAEEAVRSLQEGETPVFVACCD